MQTAKRYTLLKRHVKTHQDNFELSGSRKQVSAILLPVALCKPGLSSEDEDMRRLTFDVLSGPLQEHG